MKKEQEHFENKRPHSEIKHKLLSETLKAAIGIANRHAPRYEAFKNYVFIDLFAGQGIFEDGTEGSPVIALNTMINYLENTTKNFDKLCIIPIEKDSENQNKLVTNLTSIIQENQTNEIDILTGQDDWSNFLPVLQAQLKEYKSGFIFVDPFSTELKISQLNDLMKQAELHDTLILINVNGLERILGRSDDDSLNKVCEYFDVDIATVKSFKDAYNENAAIIRNLINISLKDKKKDFVINIAIPRTNRGKLEDSDRFYLCLLTGSVGVVNAFLKTYAELLGTKETIAMGGQGSLFAGMAEVIYFNLSNKILDIMETGATTSLLDIVTRLYDDFYSWKEAASTEIPTSNNLHKAINNLLETKQIKIVSSNNKYENANKLKGKAFTSKANLEKSTIQKLAG
jgi:three-Cys-motif partner protein